eukprot:CAMPEP_0204914350 /NCGR_PEP_ID=MMETSP1397-20131031/12209_1 /ASSEMBLY_ACC=CAM_ASM_000891 /TAXON_ID=49980 /ORGANISM="Climacostomum Climacostomum virens, Strain Stock W-24" /LENGTH=61 /DNA_ID=CAMNT_0052085871 /DNA_START=579 /DNA_END=761 /DNA_ORIENTATION=+
MIADSESAISVAAHSVDISVVSYEGCMLFATPHLSDDHVEAAKARIAVCLPSLLSCESELS